MAKTREGREADVVRSGNMEEWGYTRQVIVFVTITVRRGERGIRIESKAIVLSHSSKESSR